MLESKIIEKCSFCEKELSIPKEIDENIRKAREKPSDLDNSPLKKQYDGFYVNTYGHYYCNTECAFVHRRLTEFSNFPP